MLGLGLALPLCATAAGTGPSLSLDFLSSTSLDSRVTFTRASSATRVNASGLIETVGNNVARFDYDPVTLAAWGLLIEEARTNLLLNSATLSTQNVTVTAVAHTLSFYGTGTVTLSGASTAGPLVGGGAYPTRSTLTFTPSAGTLTLTVTGTVQNAQLEIGSFATSWIPTTGVSATRAADVATIATSAFAFNAAAGTLAAGYFLPFAPVAQVGVSELSDGGSDDRVALVVRGPATVLNRAQVSVGAATQALFDSADFVAGTVIKTGIAYAENDFARSVNGSVPSTDNSGTIPPLNILSIGSRPQTTAGPFAAGQFLNGYVRFVAYYPTRLPNAQLQQVTA